MKKGLLRKVLLWAGVNLLILTMVLCVHIYLVTRPKAPDANTVAMARIDIKQSINEDDANKIGAWLYDQAGIDHASCNAKTGIVIFTFHPLTVSADKVVAGINTTLNYKAIRYMPSAAEMKAGCPVASTSITYKTYNFIKHIF